VKWLTRVIEKINVSTPPRSEWQLSGSDTKKLLELIQKQQEQLENLELIVSGKMVFSLDDKTIAESSKRLAELENKIETLKASDGDLTGIEWRFESTKQYTDERLSEFNMHLNQRWRTLETSVAKLQEMIKGMR
jgi:hypothetical protein